MYVTNEYKTLSVLCLWRIFSVFIVQTAHVPDEYWQSLEVAHHLVFGYGVLTWEWTAKIRSYIYPFLISLLYRLLVLLGLDNVTTLTILPRVFQAVISAYGDYRFYKWTRSKWMLYSLCTNWYWYYCATRTLINTVETTCTIIALSMFPWKDSPVKNINYMWIVGVLCMARPTAVIIWLPLCLYHISSSSLQNKFLLLCQYGMVSGSCLLFSILLDSYCYGTFTISFWRFFQINVLHAIGDFYGKQHMLWYIFSALPVILGLYYIGFLVAIYQILKYPKRFHRQAILIIVIGWTLCIYSLLSHKEFRFVLPLLPMLIYITVSCVGTIKIRWHKSVHRITVILLTLSNFIPGFYFSLIHQRGTLDVMQVLQTDFTNTHNTSQYVLFLTPCHATPMYSHLHKNISVRFLTCEPNFNGTMNYLDEADQFFEQPMQWLHHNYVANKKITLPTHIVLFDNVESKISKFLNNYQLLVKLFHTHFPESNYGKYLMIYKYIAKE